MQPHFPDHEYYAHFGGRRSQTQQSEWERFCEVVGPMVARAYQKASTNHQGAERFVRAAGHFLDAVVDARPHVAPRHRTVLNYRKDWRIVGSTAGILTALSAVLAGWAARASNGVTSSPGSSITAGAGPVAPGTAPAGKPGQLVVGKLPGAPSSFQNRPELAALARAFGAGGRVVMVCALTGARGVGKTQIAAAYAREQAASGCPLVAWVSAAESTDRLVARLAEVARPVGVADPGGDSTESALRLRDHLQTRPDPAVLVIDNAVDADLLRCFSGAVDPSPVSIAPWPSWVPRWTCLCSPARSRWPTCGARTGLDDEEGAGQVADELGDLPLVLAQAASVIQSQRISYPEYLARLRALPVAKMLPRRSGDSYPKGTAEAILL